MWSCQQYRCSVISDILNIFNYKHFVKKGNVASFCAVCNAIWHWCICVAIELNELYLLHHSVYDVERATLPLEAVPARVPAEKPSTAPKSVKAPAKPPPAQVMKLEARAEEIAEIGCVEFV